jgi:uracil-DNA glycosylase
MTCFKCDISTARKNIVWGYGKIPSQIMFIGEAPGYYEDKFGEPFVGASGKLLTDLLNLIGLSRKEVFITNLIRCRPTGNRTPYIIEISNCFPHLVREITEVNPTLIVTLGGTATMLFSVKRGLSITKHRGKPFIFGRRIILPTFHPSYVLRDIDKRSILEDDFKLLSKLYSRINPFYNSI